jgi:hypothetical protein
MTDRRYSVGSELIEQVIQALDNASVTLGQVVEGRKPADPMDAYREAAAAYDALCAVVAEHLEDEDD